MYLHLLLLYQTQMPAMLVLKLPIYMLHNRMRYLVCSESLLKITRRIYLKETAAFICFCATEIEKQFEESRRRQYTLGGASFGLGMH